MSLFLLLPKTEGEDGFKKTVYALRPKKLDDIMNCIRFHRAEVFIPKFIIWKTYAEDIVPVKKLEQYALLTFFYILKLYRQTWMSERVDRQMANVV